MLFSLNFTTANSVYIPWQVNTNKQARTHNTHVQTNLFDGFSNNAVWLYPLREKFRSQILGAKFIFFIVSFESGLLSFVVNEYKPKFRIRKSLKDLGSLYI